MFLLQIDLIEDIYCQQQGRREKSRGPGQTFILGHCDIISPQFFDGRALSKKGALVKSGTGGNLFPAAPHSRQAWTAIYFLMTCMYFLLK
jgi:hypothetical protein